MTFAAFALGVYAFAFYSVDAINPPFKLRFEAYPVLARLLIFPAGLALIVSAFQFSRRIRTTYPGLHRYSGRIYITAGVAGAVGGFVIAFKAHGSPVTSFSFGTLAVIRACSVAGISLRPRAILPLTRCG